MVLSTTHALWSFIPDHSVINISALQLMSFVAQIPLMWFLSMNFVACFCLILFLTKSHISKWVRYLANFHLFIYLLASIIKMIISSFYFHFMIFCTNSSLNNILAQYFLPLFCNDFFVFNIQFRVPLVMLWIFQKVGMHKLFWMYEHSYPSDLSNTIFLSLDYLLSILTPILQLCQKLWSLYLPPVLSCFLREHFLLPLHERQFRSEKNCQLTLIGY